MDSKKNLYPCAFQTICLHLCPLAFVDTRACMCSLYVFTSVKTIYCPHVNTRAQTSGSQRIGEMRWNDIWVCSCLLACAESIKRLQYMISDYGNSARRWMIDSHLAAVMENNNEWNKKRKWYSTLCRYLLCVHITFPIFHHFLGQRRKVGCCPLACDYQPCDP